jgi:predicted porin
MQGASVNIFGKTLLACGAGIALCGAAQAADVPTSKPAAPPPPAAPASCTSPLDFATTDCPLTWYGVTFYGAIDMGVGWESHGTPFNRNIISGVEEFIQKNSNHAQWLPTPGGLTQSNLGVKGKEDLALGWSFVFDLSFGFDPYSLSLANGPKSYLDNNGVRLANQTSNADSSRAGQFYNGAGYAGISSTTFGTLTAGRQNSFTLDGVIAYDPMGASYAFSPIGWSGLTAGAGDTEDARYTTSVKYRIDTGMLRAGALYQFGGYELNNGTQHAFEATVGGDANFGAYGKLSVDAIYTQDIGAVSSAPLATAALAAKFPGTIAATISDDTSVMLLAKYTYEQFKLFGGFEEITFANPHDPQLTNFTDIAGIPVVAANITNTAYTNHRIMQISWTGARYDFTDTFDVGAAYYHYNQPSYNTFSCNNQTISSKCAGTMNAFSVDADWRFAKKFDVYAGVMYSQVNGGLANGYLYRSNLSPTAGLRFRF